MNIIVGYLQSNGDEAHLEAEVRALLAMGCQTVRTEAAEAPDKVFKPVLNAVCDFLGPGDQLVVPDITHLGSSPSSAEALLDGLDRRGARVRLLARHDDLRFSSPKAAPWQEPLPVLSARGRGVDPGAVRALSAHGLGPSQIARALGVSRMTVWRKLAAVGA